MSVGVRWTSVGLLSDFLLLSGCFWWTCPSDSPVRQACTGKSPESHRTIAAPPELKIRILDRLSPTESARKTRGSVKTSFNSLNIKYPKPEPQRSKAAPALHLGVWETYRMRPIISSNALDQAPDVIEAMDTFLSLVGTLIASRLRTLLRQYFPQQYGTSRKACRNLFLLYRLRMGL